jgi:HSP20 family molecular chaperone IbpA
MANATTKNILLSQSKTGASEDIQAPALSHNVYLNSYSTEVKIEVPGVDPSTIEVGFENNQIEVRCERGVLSFPVDPTVDISEIKADIVWGMLTLQIPLPEPPVSRSIKVNIHETTAPKVKSHSKVQVEPVG